jgi:hypothetical protein
MGACTKLEISAPASLKKLWTIVAVCGARRTGAKLLTATFGTIAAKADFDVIAAARASKTRQALHGNHRDQPREQCHSNTPAKKCLWNYKHSQNAYCKNTQSADYDALSLAISRSYGTESFTKLVSVGVRIFANLTRRRYDWGRKVESKGFQSS